METCKETVHHVAVNWNEQRKDDRLFHRFEAQSDILFTSLKHILPQHWEEVIIIKIHNDLWYFYLFAITLFLSPNIPYYKIYCKIYVWMVNYIGILSDSIVYMLC